VALGDAIELDHNLQPEPEHANEHVRQGEPLRVVGEGARDRSGHHERHAGRGQRHDAHVG